MMPMRRKDRQVTEKEEILQIEYSGALKAPVRHLGNQ